MLFRIHEFLVLLAAAPSNIPPENIHSAAKIFLDYGSFIRKIINSSVKDSHLRNDIYQELFIAISQKPIPDGVNNMKGYLGRLVRNFATNSLRKIERYQRNVYQHNLEAIRRNHWTSENISLSKYVEPMQIFELAESKLAAHQAKVILLKHQEKLKNAEVAKKLKIGKNTVNAYYSAGLRRLRAILKESGELN